MSNPSAGNDAPTYHHFESMSQQKATSTFGMWLFLTTEIMFFGGLFSAYYLYKGMYPEAFEAASHHSHLWLGILNTAVLLGSSYTMVLAVHASKLGKKNQIVGYLIATLILGSTFLGVKAIEYHHHFADHLLPGSNFHMEGPFGREAQIFFSLYFAMTGMHAVHMIVGVGLLIVLTIMAYKGRFSEKYHTPVELSGLYWHFVDVVWIFLFPMFYLIGGVSFH